MLKLLSAALIAAVFSFQSIAQTETLHAKKHNHFIGIQANELLRQLFNFNDNNTAITNPYLLTYSFTLNENIGLHAGIGYEYSLVTHKNSPVGSTTKVDNIFYRLGVEKRMFIGKRFEAGGAFDIVNSFEYDKTFTSSVSNLGSTIDTNNTTITNKSTTFGAGPQLSLAFYITDKIMLGTEATMYYTINNSKKNVLAEKISILIFNNNERIVTLSNFNDEIETRKFQITLPVALFLIIKL